jgi:hypothetical protein
MSVYVNVQCVCICMYVQFVCMYNLYVCMCVCMYVCMHACMYVCKFVSSVYAEGGRQQCPYLSVDGILLRTIPRAGSRSSRPPTASEVVIAET